MQGVGIGILHPGDEFADAWREEQDGPIGGIPCGAGQGDGDGVDIIVKPLGSCRFRLEYEAPGDRLQRFPLGEGIVVAPCKRGPVVLA